MDAVILTIGDELLYGQTVDTNSAYMGRELAKIGVRVHEILSVSDNEAHIIEGLDHAKTKGDIILVTGGLGPTRDDLTKHTLVKYFHTELVMNREILNLLEEFFKKRGIAMLPSHRDQALMPAACIPLRNTRGTAWGMWFEQDGKVFVSMPGVPHEMMALMQQEVLPKIKAHFALPVILHRHINTAGLGESYIAEKINEVEDNLPANIKLAYLPEYGMVRLRLTATGSDMAALEKEMNVQGAKISTAIEKYIYGYDDVTLEKALGLLLLEKGAHISTAESCTGGYIASRITSVPGSSGYYKGSAVVYTGDIKQNLLGVKKETLQQFGAVSEEAVKEMLAGACKLFNTEYAIAVTGISGPDTDERNTPIGLIWVAVGTALNTITRKLTLTYDRDQNIRITSVQALELMRKYLAGYL